MPIRWSDHAGFDERLNVALHHFHVRFDLRDLLRRWSLSGGASWRPRDPLA